MREGESSGCLCLNYHLGLLPTDPVEPEGFSVFGVPNEAREYPQT